MPQVAAATALCRVGLALRRSSATGVLTVQGREREGQLALSNGQLVGASMVGHAGEASMGHALHAQLRERLFELIQWSAAAYRFDATLRDFSGSSVDPPLPIEDAVWFAMRKMAQEAVPLWRVKADVGTHSLRLTEAGQGFAQLSALDADQKAMFDLLRDGAGVDALLRATTNAASRLRDLWSLKLLGAIAPDAGGSYGLLLRKRRQIDRDASAHTLLDLPSRATGSQARRALRRLVRDLHPDRFGRYAPSFLKRTSTEVVSALVRAEAQISGG